MSNLVSDVLKVDPEAPKAVWNHFSEFCRHPRPSKHETKIRQYLKSVAEKNHLILKEDRVGNTIIYLPASKGHEHCKPVLIQNHIDMVTDALPDIKIDFMNDPIRPIVHGEWVKATGTTLGADNGIGACLALAMIDHRDDIVHPPLELLFTIDEETGLTGALELDASMIQAKVMLNIDTEEWGALYIGCAGGLEIKYQQEYQVLESLKDASVVKVKVSGLVGGHSGLDIHRQRGNANVMLVDLLNLMKEKVDLIAMSGGKAHNIIPRNASVEFALDGLSHSEFQVLFDQWKMYWLKILPKEDRENFLAEYEITKQKYSCIAKQTWLKCINSFLQQFPHGAHQFVMQEGETEPLVRLSNNFAKIQLNKGVFSLLTSIRFFEKDEGERFKEKCIQLGNLHGLKMEIKNGYPSWAPDFNSHLLSKVIEVYQKNYGSKPQVKAIHAGLECGIILAKIPGMEAISMGPLIMGAHSPDEKVLIKDVTNTWHLLTFVLADLVG